MWRQSSSAASGSLRRLCVARRTTTTMRPFSKKGLPASSSLQPLRLSNNKRSNRATACFSSDSSSSNKDLSSLPPPHRKQQPQPGQQQERQATTTTTTPSSSSSSSSSPPKSAKAVIAAFAQDLQKSLRFAESITTPMPLMKVDDEYNDNNNNMMIGGDDSDNVGVNVGGDTERQEVFQQATDLWDALLQAVREGAIQPQGKNRREASIFCETLLRLYAESESAPVDPNHHSNSNNNNYTAVWEACRTILDFMQLHKITIQEDHCQAAMTVAVRAGAFHEAAVLFRQQTDPRMAGYQPYRTMSVAEPIGLLALAKDAQQRGSAIVENVMHAVHQMILVSPSDQEQYVLAAGTALGHVGQGQGLLNYLQTSLEAPRLGPSLVAATMQACLLSGDAATAWHLWQERTAQGAAETEWQWSGGEEALPPLCTDLALRAAPAVPDEIHPEHVLSLYRGLIQGGRTVSVEALVGVMRVLEEHGAWEDAVELWLHIVSRMNRHPDLPFLVYGDGLSCPDIEQAAPTSDDLWRDLSHVVVPVMRACYGAQEYALGWVCLSLWQGCLDKSVSNFIKDNEWSSVLQSTIAQSSNSEEMLLSLMTCLSGLDLPEAACELYNAATEKGVTSPEARDLYEYASSMSSSLNPLQRGRMLATLGDEVQRFALVHSSLNSLSEEDSKLVACALASTMQSLTAWKNPTAALFLFRWTMLPRKNDHHSAKSLAGVLDLLGTKHPGLPLTDSLVSSLLDAYFMLGDPESASQVFEIVNQAQALDKNDWPLSTTSVIRILFSNNAVDEAMYMFQRAASSSSYPGLYITTAQGLASHGKWKEVSDVYRLALTSGALSEEVSLVAMQAIEMLKVPEKTRLMRSIADEAAALSGMAPLAWTERQYHRLKATISFSSIRRLLWWDDPKTAHLDELELVLGEWEARKNTTTAAATKPTAPHLPSISIILNCAKSLNEQSIPPNKTRIPHVPKSQSAWKSLVDEIVQDLDWTMYRSSKLGESVVNDVIHAYRNLGSDDDCLAFTFYCLEHEMPIGEEALREALEAAVAMEDDTSASTLQMVMERSLSEA